MQFEPNNKEALARLRQCEEIIRTNAFRELQPIPFTPFQPRPTAVKGGPRSSIFARNSIQTARKPAPRATNKQEKEKEKEKETENEGLLIPALANRIPPPWSTPLNSIPKLTEIAIRTISAEVTSSPRVYLEALKTGNF